MTPQLYSIEQAPRHLPVWQTIMEDLCHPPPARVARVLGISVRTVYRYDRTGEAPRSVCLALFWLTRWGRSAVHVQATNDALLAVGYVRALRDQIRQLEADITHLRLVGDFGSANDPGDGRVAGRLPPKPAGYELLR